MYRDPLAGPIGPTRTSLLTQRWSSLHAPVTLLDRYYGRL